MTLSRTAIVLIALSFALSACTVTVVVPGPSFDLSVDASGLSTGLDVPDVLETVTVPANSELWVRVRFASTPGADLRYVEIVPTGAGSGLQLEWWSSLTGSMQLVSRSASMFGPTESALVSSAPSAVERSSIAVAWPCLGPCIARSFASGSATIRVVNDASSARTVQLYAYARPFADENEPNDSAAAATAFTATAIGQTIVGAIETSADVDWFRVDCSGGPLGGQVGFSFDSGFDGPLELTVLGGVGESNETIGPGEDTTGFFVCPVDVRVRSVDGTAGSPAVSRYTITIR